MKRQFRASIAQEDSWFVAQCLDVDVASQGESPEEAIRNLQEALALHLEPPVATLTPDIQVIEVEIGAA